MGSSAPSGCSILLPGEPASALCLCMSPAEAKLFQAMWYKVAVQLPHCLYTPENRRLSCLDAAWETELLVCVFEAALCYAICSS